MAPHTAENTPWTTPNTACRTAWMTARTDCRAAAKVEKMEEMSEVSESTIVGMIMFILLGPRRCQLSSLLSLRESCDMRYDGRLILSLLTCLIRGVDYPEGK